MKFSCCIEMIFTEYDFIDRFYKAKEHGFEYVEFWNWDNKDIDKIESVLKETGLKVAAFQGSSKGTMADSNDHELFFQGVKQGLEVANRLNCECVFVMSEMLQEDRSVAPTSRPLTDNEKFENSLIALKKLAPLAQQHKVTCVIEPLNTFVDHKGYSLSSSDKGAKLIREVNSPYIKMLYDAYHMQIMEGNICNNIISTSDTFGHFHIADVPGRFQPGTGELNYANILNCLKKTGYDKVVGWEFEPKDGSSEKVVKDVFNMFKDL